ncbi:MAG TPA: glycosyltransferase family 4 protein [Blastocatellia bacterium]|nr:glycosyltransferase family 4 protein [Blastocatellia bacterium]
MILTSSFPNGPGDETCGYVRDFARTLASEFNVEVLAPADLNAGRWPEDLFTLRRSRPPLPKSLDPFRASADFNNLPSRNFVIKIASAVSLAFFLKDAARLAARADVICSHWMLPSGLVGALLSRALGKPHIVVEHSGALHHLARMRGGPRLARFIIGGCHRVITVSEDLKRKLISLCSDASPKVEVIPMGIRETSAPPPRPPRLCGESASQRKSILFIGRLTEVKGAEVLVRAMQGIEGARLLVAGDGEQRHTLEALARHLSVNAKFLGQVGAEERDNLLSACDAVAIPSRVLGDGRTEGMPVVCLEAMAAGQPVIASRVGGLAEIIIESHNGLLFEPGNHEMLREKLMLVLGDARVRETLSQNARLTASLHSWPRTGTRFIKIIKACLEPTVRFQI